MVAIFKNEKIEKKRKMGEHFNFSARILTIKTRLLHQLLTLIVSILLISGCNSNSSDARVDITNWKNTPAWELAKAVRDEDISKIKKIAIENPQLLNCVEPVEKSPLIRWCVGMEKYNSLKALLENGANPNIATIYGKTALYEAAGFSWIDCNAKKDAKYVKLLLQHGADPNLYFKGGEPGYTYEAGNSPLIESIGCGIEKTKALVEKGADINHKTSGSQSTAAIIALDCSEYPDYAYYLIVEKKANVADCYYLNYKDPENPHKKFYPVNTLRMYWIYDLDSPEYKKKMEIVKEFKRQGIDYWKTKPDEKAISDIKEFYADTWQEYIKKY